MSAAAAAVADAEAIVEDELNALIADRTEADAVADAVWALVEAGIIERTGPVLAKVAKIVGLPVAALQAADHRAGQGLYLPPDFLTKRYAGWSEEARLRWRKGAKKGQDAAAKKRTRQPKKGQRTMVCRTCSNDLSIDEFLPRADRFGKRVTQCNSCRREASRDRYLSVAKKKAMNVAHLTFVINENDVSLGLTCLGCGRDFKAGDHVDGNAQLSHVDCA